MKTFDARNLEWHKITGLVMAKLGVTEVELTSDDLRPFVERQMAVAADLRGGRFVVRLLTEEQGQALVAEARETGAGVIE